jgi:hypothetical protein
MGGPTGGAPERWGPRGPTRSGLSRFERGRLGQSGRRGGPPPQHRIRTAEYWLSILKKSKLIFLNLRTFCFCRLPAGAAPPRNRAADSADCAAPSFGGAQSSRNPHAKAVSRRATAQTAVKGVVTHRAAWPPAGSLCGASARRGGALARAGRGGRAGARAGRPLWMAMRQPKQCAGNNRRNRGGVWGRQENGRQRAAHKGRIDAGVGGCWARRWVRAFRWVGAGGSQRGAPGRWGRAVGAAGLVGARGAGHCRVGRARWKTPVSIVWWRQGPGRRRARRTRLDVPAPGRPGRRGRPGAALGRRARAAPSDARLCRRPGPARRGCRRREARLGPWHARPKSPVPG